MQVAAQKILYNFKQLQPRTSWSFRHIERKETNAHTHSYHRYPAKFIPQIVQQLIKKFAPTGKEIICDPFGGCGTTLVEAKISGRRSIGFDINPIAKLITETKVTPINPKLLEKCREEFMDNYKNSQKKTLPKCSRVNYWFDTATIKRLDRVYFSIKKIENKKARKFFFCAFSHILKNCSRWLMKSIKPTIDKDKKIPDVKEVFLRHLDSMIQKNKVFYCELVKSGNLNVPAVMYRRDSTKPLPIKKNSIDLVITSPPYVTSYEYADLHQLSLLWLGRDASQFKGWHKFTQEFNEFRKKFIGTSYKQSKDVNFNSYIAEEIINRLEIIDKPLAADVANYFSDMRRFFSEIYRIIKFGGKACVIIGNTTLKGVEIINAQVAAEQMLRLGFRKVNFIKREVLNKMITPWRDKNTGKFTSLSNPAKKRVYQFEYIIVMEK